MINNLKALVVVLAFALVLFTLMKPVAVRFMGEAVFVRRRNAWLLLTVAAFLIPNFFAFVALTVGTVL